MGIDVAAFQVPKGAAVDLSNWATAVKPLCESKKAYSRLLLANAEKLSDQQRLLFASNRYALLVVFQAMDTAGKDGAIRHVMSCVNPQGCHVTSFKSPSAEELDHDYLWRASKALPQRGMIGIFNRSYYEEVLAVKLHPEFLAK